MTDPQSSHSPDHSLLHSQSQDQHRLQLGVSKYIGMYAGAIALCQCICSHWCLSSPGACVWDGQLPRVERRRWVHWHIVFADQECLAEPPRWQLVHRPHAPAVHAILRQRQPRAVQVAAAANVTCRFRLNCQMPVSALTCTRIASRCPAHPALCYLGCYAHGVGVQAV